ncbi:MAG: HNH endonuclease signature motif containing protein [Acidimicrobiales bacterium]
MTEGEIVGSGPIPDALLEELACTSGLTGMIFSTDGRALWMGREVRLATPAQWLALMARDGGCVGCGADPSRCEAHHIVPWEPPGKGPTDIDNLVLLCRHHHHLVHDQRWRISWGNGGYSLAPPRSREPAA